MQLQYVGPLRVEWKDEAKREGSMDTTWSCVCGETFQLFCNYARPVVPNSLRLQTLWRYGWFHKSYSNDWSSFVGKLLQLILNDLWVNSKHPCLIISLCCRSNCSIYSPIVTSRVHEISSSFASVLLYFALNNLFELNAFGENAKGYATERLFDAPLTKSRTPTEFWTKRWNHMTHKLLKVCQNQRLYKSFICRAHSIPL